MQAQLHPVELLEHVVGEVELAVAPDVDLRAAQLAERRNLLVHRGDLLRLTAQVVGVEPRHDADVRRVVADRDVVVTQLARGERHLEHGRLAVGPRAVHVQVTANVGPPQKRRRLTAKRPLPQLGRAPWHAECRVHPLFAGTGGEVAERVDVRGRPGRAQQLRAEARRLGDDELDGDALDRDSHRAARRALEHRDDRRQPLERIEHGLRLGCRAHDGEVE